MDSTSGRRWSAGISQKDAVLRADEWAAGFYGDALLQFVECQFKTNPIRHWLVTFRKLETGQQYYAVILPDGRVVMPTWSEDFEVFSNPEKNFYSILGISARYAKTSDRTPHKTAGQLRLNLLAPRE
jgi:hypothetical protein